MVSETHFGLALLLLVSAATMAQQPADAQSEQEDSEARVVQLPWHSYFHYLADFPAWSRAARGFHGRTSALRRLDVKRAALLLMHLPDAGLTTDTKWGPDCPRPDLRGATE